MAFSDTSTDLVWVQCKPCKKCYQQTDPIFDPSKSETYKAANCFSQACKIIKENSCKKTSLSLKCQYNETYMDGSVSYGDVGQETFTFDTNVKNSRFGLNNIIFGCSREYKGNFEPKSAGIVGLGNGVASLTSQLGTVIHNKFSYRLSHEPNISSLLYSGTNDTVSTLGTVSTPLKSRNSLSPYYLSLYGMTVAGKRLNFVNPFGSAGNIILDTSTTLTLIPTYFYNKLESLVAAQINLRPFPIKTSLNKGVKFCYQTTPSTFKAPQIIVHFAGADIALNQYNTFVLIDGLMCFTFNVDDRVPVFVNIAQANFLVGIDRQKKVVSFKPTDCSKLQ
ncbi:putative nepenthesin [Lupinus albus]|uniref:Putative nepenthesin n=1 Tax=Lupinus albus TaxID=3870 RepID=A0A6A4P0C3_LUPAL|nr:putative nepenthesin [Lupinus albus]